MRAGVEHRVGGWRWRRIIGRIDGSVAGHGLTHALEIDNGHSRDEEEKELSVSLLGRSCNAVELGGWVEEAEEEEEREINEVCSASTSSGGSRFGILNQLSRKKS